jgi:hypothetical protein
MKTLRIALVIAATTILLRPAWAQPGTLATSVVGYPGAGVLQGGDLWDSFLPQAFGPFYSEYNTAPTEGIRQFLRMGNFDRQWTTPGGHWPRAFPWTMFWEHFILAQCYDPDTNFNPTKKGVALPATGNYAQVTYKSTLPGASDPTRKYSYEPYFVDGNRRQHAVYEAGWPTNVGLDVKMRAHVLSGPNWGHFNDFIIIEIEFKNTGVRDMNLDGIPDALLSSTDIKAMTLLMSGDIYMSISTYNTGNRSQNSFSTKYTRMGGWIDDPDPDGYPWAFAAYYPGAKDQVPAPGTRNMGMNAPTLGSYTDTWSGWMWLDVKNGGLPTDASKTSSTLTSTPNIFGVHPVGIGPERGWYLSAGSGGFLSNFDSYTDPKRMHQIASGTFLKNGGSTRTIAQIDDSPDPNFFASGTPGNVLSFVKKATPARPRGDQKILGTFSQAPFEDGAGYAPGWGSWSRGYTYAHNFDGELYTGIGPMSIPVGESRTFVLAMVAGYRLEGVQKAVRAARYTYANDFNVPSLPPTPEMKVSHKFPLMVNVEWDNRAESDAQFQGYKIWRSTQTGKKKWLEEGLRLSDRYQEQMTPGEDFSALKKPVNPYFDAFAEVNNSSSRGEYLPDTWGTWKLVKTIPKSELAQHAGASPGYNYQYRDTDIVFGNPYWYYVSAYKEGTFTGPGGETTNRIETAALNMNGATGLWINTYPYAPRNANYPKTVQGLKNIGAPLTMLRPLAFDTLSQGGVNLGSHRNLDIRLRNSMDDTMKVDATSNNTSFVLATSSLSIPPHDSVLMSISFVPSRLGPDTARCLFTIQGDPSPFSLFLTGTGTSGTVAPALAWQNVGHQFASYVTGPYVAFDKSGTAYSAVMASLSPYIWELRRHDATGGTQWSVSDTAFGPLPSLVGLAIDSAGDLYLAVNGSASRPPNSGAMSVAKVSPGGQMLWFQSITHPSDLLIYMSGSTVDKAGNAYATGYSYSRATGNNTRITTAKVGVDGFIRWVANQEGLPVGVDSTDVGRAVAVDSVGNVYITGQSGGSTYGNIVTVKYDAAGVFQWASNYDGPSSLSDVGVSLAVTQDGEVFVVGQSAGLQGNNDIVVLKYRGSDGFLLWSDRYDGAAHSNDNPSAIIIGDDGRILVSGSTTTSNGSTDGILLRYTPGGSRELLLQFDGSARSNDNLGALNKDLAGNMYVGGNSTGALGAMEAVLLKFSPQGMLEWETHYAPESVGDTYLTSVAVATTGQVAMGGYTRVNPLTYDLAIFVASFGERPVSVSDHEEEVPMSSALLQNYPNPFNPKTVIRYQVSGVSEVKLKIYDLLGREVAVLVNERKLPGRYDVTFDGGRLASGVYFYRMEAGSFVQSRKLLLIK